MGGVQIKRQVIRVSQSLSALEIEVALLNTCHSVLRRTSVNMPAATVQTPKSNSKIKVIMPLKKLRRQRRLKALRNLVVRRLLFPAMNDDGSSSSSEMGDADEVSPARWTPHSDHSVLAPYIRSEGRSPLAKRRSSRQKSMSPSRSPQRPPSGYSCPSNSPDSSPILARPLSPDQPSPITEREMMHLALSATVDIVELRLS